MTKIKRFLVTAALAGATALAPLSAEAFFGMMSAMMGGGWGGWGGWGYPYYGYGWGYPYYGYGWGGWGYPHYGYGWGYPHYGYGGYGWGYPYAGYPLVATAPVVVAQPATTAAK